MKGEGKEKINLTDRDANHMKPGGSKDIRPGYNCQAVVTESGIIVAGEAVTEANDRNQLKPMIEKTELNTQEKVKEVGADSGYGSYANYEYLEERGSFSAVQVRRISKRRESISLHQFYL